MSVDEDEEVLRGAYAAQRAGEDCRVPVSEAVANHLADGVYLAPADNMSMQIVDMTSQ